MKRRKIWYFPTTIIAPLWNIRLDIPESEEMKISEDNDYAASLASRYHLSGFTRCCSILILFMNLAGYLSSLSAPAHIMHNIGAVMPCMNTRCLCVPSRGIDGRWRVWYNMTYQLSFHDYYESIMMGWYHRHLRYFSMADEDDEPIVARGYEGNDFAFALYHEIYHERMKPYRDIVSMSAALLFDGSIRTCWWHALLICEEMAEAHYEYLCRATFLFIGAIFRDE